MRGWLVCLQYPREPGKAAGQLETPSVRVKTEVGALDQREAEGMGEFSGC